jgi:hypothetical protein
MSKKKKKKKKRTNNKPNNWPTNDQNNMGNLASIFLFSFSFFFNRKSKLLQHYCNIKPTNIKIIIIKNNKK